MELEKLQSMNTLSIYDVTDSRFERYGRMIEGLDISELVSLADRSTKVDPEGNRYVPSMPELESLPIISEIGATIFGGMPIQVGYCNGPNQQLNGMEYHKSTEVFIAVTDCVLFLGRTGDIEDFRSYASDRAEAFLFPSGTVFECFPHTLHFAPCKTHRDGFKSIIILPRGTNGPLEVTVRQSKNPETRLLFARDKWLLVHPDRTPLVKQGAWVGIMGKNPRIDIQR
ncbi:MAG: DUF4867 family protein [Sphaerochaeta sp.]|nr:DUF4867 family protein [Sphaerochaeta sp.]